MLNIRLNPKYILGAIVFFLTALPVILFDYPLEFSLILLSHFVMASVVLYLTKVDVEPQRITAGSDLFAKFAIGYLLIVLIWNYVVLVLTRDVGGNQVQAAIQSESGGSAIASILGAVQWVLLGMVASSRYKRLFLILVLIQVSAGVVFGSHRSPIIFLVVAYILHRRKDVSLFQLAAILVLMLVALTVLNFKRMGLEIETLIDVGTFIRGVFVANNFYDLWVTRPNIDVIELLGRLPLVFVPSAIYPEKGVVSFSHIMTNLVYGYDPINDLMPIITFGFFAETWVYLGYMSFLLSGIAIFLYVQLIKKALRVSRFLGFYYAMVFVMIYRSGLDSFLFNVTINYLVLTVLIEVSRLSIFRRRKMGFI